LFEGISATTGTRKRKEGTLGKSSMILVMTVLGTVSPIWTVGTAHAALAEAAMDQYCLPLQEPNPLVEWEIGPEIYHFQYEEPSVDVEEDGVMFGLTGSFTHHNPSRLMFTAEGRGAWGEVDYTGTGMIDGIPDWTLEGRLAAGYDIHLDEFKRFTPFFGIGYRYLNDDSSGMTSTTGAVGYERESNYLYSPIGLMFDARLSGGWRIGMKVEYDLFWSGKQITHLEDVDPSLNTVTNKQRRGFGLRGSLTFQKKVGEKIDVAIKPFIRWWRIKNSEFAVVTFAGTPIGLGLEPKNETIEAGGQISILF